MNFSWQQVPFFRLILPFILGIGLSTYLQPPTLLGYILGGIMFFIALLISLTSLQYPKRWLRGGIAGFLLFITGFLLYQNNDPRLQSTHFQNFITDSSSVLGQISSIPKTKKSLHFELKIHQVINKKDRKNASGKIVTYLALDSLAQKLKIGDFIHLKSSIQTIEPPKNPEQFNYQRYLFYKKIHFQTYARAEQWQQIPYKQGNLVIWADQVRLQALAIIQQHLPEKRTQEVAAALLLGYKTDLSDETKAIYTNTGAVHILAVSGLHVGIVLALLRFLLQFFPTRKTGVKILKTGIIIISLWVFALLTGLSPSVLRATLMFSLVNISLDLNRKSSIYNTVALSAFLLLFLDPYYLFDVGFQLSYLAVLSIIFLQPKIAGWLPIKNKLANYFWQLTAVSIAAQLGTLAISLYYFHQFPLWFWLSSMIVIPAAFAVLSIGIPFLILGSFSTLAGQFLGLLLTYLIGTMNVLIEIISKFPHAVIQGIWISELEVFLLLFGVFSFGLLLTLRQLRWANFTFGILTVMSAISLFTQIQTKQFRGVLIYHSNQLTAIDFIIPHQSFSFLSDTSNLDAFNFIAQNYQWSKRVKNPQIIDYQQDMHDIYLIKKDNLFTFFDKTFFLVTPSTSNLKTSVDYVILDQNPETSLEEIYEHTKFTTVIFTVQNHWKKVEQWKEEAEILGLKYYNIKEKGCFLLEL